MAFAEVASIQLNNASKLAQLNVELNTYKKKIEALPSRIDAAWPKSAGEKSFVFDTLCSSGKVITKTINSYESIVLIYKRVLTGMLKMECVSNSAMLELVSNAQKCAIVASTVTTLKHTKLDTVQLRVIAQDIVKLSGNLQGLLTQYKQVDSKIDSTIEVFLRKCGFNIASINRSLNTEILRLNNIGKALIQVAGYYEMAEKIINANASKIGKSQQNGYGAWQKTYIRVKNTNLQQTRLPAFAKYYNNPYSGYANGHKVVEIANLEGNVGPYGCWRYASDLYKAIWSKNFDRSSNLLYNVNYNDRKNTADNLEKYLSLCPPGAVIRIDKTHSGNNDLDGHSLVFMGMNESGDGAIFCEGNWNGSGAVRKHDWKFTDLATYPEGESNYGYTYIKYIVFPNAKKIANAQTW